MDSGLKERADVAATKRGNSDADDLAASGADNGSPDQQALTYLTGRSKLSDAALVGLHQGLIIPNLVQRVVRAGQAGAKLAAGVDTRGRAMREIVKDPAFDWGTVGPQPLSTKLEQDPSASNEAGSSTSKSRDGHRDLTSIELRDAFDILLPLVATSPQYEHDPDVRQLLITIRPRLFKPNGTLSIEVLSRPQVRDAFTFLTAGASWQEHAHETVAAFTVAVDPIVTPLLHRKNGPTEPAGPVGAAAVDGKASDGAAAPVAQPAASASTPAPAAATTAPAASVAPDAAHTEEHEADTKYANTGTDSKGPNHARAQRFAKEKSVGGYSKVYELAGLPPLLTFLSRDGVTPPTVDVFLFFHGKFAHYGTDKGDNPAQQSHLAEAVANSGRNVIAIAPSPGLGGNDGQFPLWSKLNDDNGYKKVVTNVLQQLSRDLSLPKDLAPNQISLVGHSAGGAALGDAAEQLGDQVRDVTLQDAGYEFGRSWQKLVPWFLTGKGDKTIRVITHGDPNKVAEGGVLAKHLDIKTLKDAIDRLKIQGAKPEWQPGDDAERSVEGLHLHHRVLVHGLDGQRLVSVYNFNESGKFHFEVRNRTMGALLREGPEGDFDGKQARNQATDAPTGATPQRGAATPKTSSPGAGDGLLTPDWATDPPAHQPQAADHDVAVHHSEPAVATQEHDDQGATHQPQHAPRRVRRRPKPRRSPTATSAPSPPADGAVDPSLLAGNVDASQATAATGSSAKPATKPTADHTAAAAPSTTATGEDRYLGARTVKETKTGQKLDKKSGKVVEDIHHYDGYEGYDIGSSQRMINSGGAASSAVYVTAQVETGGAYDNAQTYDRGVLSFGIMQWTLHQGSLVRFLDYLKNKSGPEGRAAFDQYFKANKIDIVDRRFVYDGQIYEGEEQMHHLVRKDLQTSKRWAIMFHEAGMDARVQKAELDYSVNQFNTLTKGSEGDLDKHTVIPAKYKDRNWAKTFSADYKGHYGNASDWCEGNPKVATLFYSMYTNNPLGSQIGMLKSINKHYGRYGLDRSKWPANWKAEFAATVEYVYGHEMFADWQDKSENGKRTHEGRVSKTMRIYQESLQPGGAAQPVAHHDGGDHEKHATHGHSQSSAQRNSQGSGHGTSQPAAHHAPDHEAAVNGLWRFAGQLVSMIEQADKAVDHALGQLAEYMHDNPQIPPHEAHRVAEHVRKAGAKAHEAKTQSTHHGRAAHDSRSRPHQHTGDADTAARAPKSDGAHAPQPHAPQPDGAHAPDAGSATASTPVSASVVAASDVGDLRSAVTALNNPQANAVLHDYEELAAKVTGAHLDRNEQQHKVRDEVLQGIRDLRGRVAALDGAGLPADKAAEVKARFYRSIQEVVSLYHSQGRNVDILEGGEKKDGKYHAKFGTSTIATRTCNVTSLSMAIEGLGKTANDYKGNRESLLAVARYCRPELAQAELSRDDGQKQAGSHDWDWGALATLRFADFMELVAINECLNGKPATNAAIEAAGTAAFSKILQLDFLRDVARCFATCEEKYFSFDGKQKVQKDKHGNEQVVETKEAGHLGVSKAQRHSIDDLIQARNQAEQTQARTDIEKYQKLKEENKAALGGNEHNIPLEAYRRAIIEQLGGELGAGAAIQTHVAQHFVRLRAVHDQHVIIDDPAKPEKAHKKVLYEEARAQGMFDMRLVIR